ncbi:MAG TPA: RNA polymerase sigma factor [Kofleriaceae bacterium]|nr:RNA polymerase sigma factor [Kofleriaceae bacterium]
MTRQALPTSEADGGELAPVAERARAGERDAFRELIERTSPRIYRLALRVLGDPDEADDVVQETYIRAWGSLEELRDPAAVMGWLSRVARNAARDRLRWWKRRPRESFDEAALPLARLVQQADSAPLADEQLAAAETGAAVARAVAALPDKHRVVLLLREADGMSYDEIAEALGVAVGTVESRLHRARAALARRLKRLAPGEVTP